MTDKQRDESWAAFDQDVDAQGGYQYTDGSRLSARIANERYTELIVDSADFAGKRVVDVGSGDGTYTAALADHSDAAEIIGVEPSPKAVERAQSAYASYGARLQFECCSSRDLLEAGKHYDIAVYRGVIHHVPDPKEEIARAVALADRVVILEPNGVNLMMKLAERLSRYHREHHERSFVPRTLSSWVNAAGGKVERVRFFGLVPYFCPDAVARLGRMLEPIIEVIPLLRAGLCGQYVLVAGGR